MNTLCEQLLTVSLISLIMAISGCTTTQIQNPQAQPRVIRASMTVEEVKQLLGNPKRVEIANLQDKGTVEVWLYEILVRESTDLVTTDTQMAVRYDPILQREVEVPEPVESPVLRTTTQVIRIGFNEGRVFKWSSEFVTDSEVQNH